MGRPRTRLAVASTLGAAIVSSSFVSQMKPVAADNASPNGSARAPIRVHFAPGTVTAKFTGKVTLRRPDVYALTAEAGQTMSVDVHAAEYYLLPVVVGVPGGEKRVDPDGSMQIWHGRIRKTGAFDIVIRGRSVIDDSCAACFYTMTITISGFPSDPRLPRGIEQVDFGDETVYFGGAAHRLRYGAGVVSPDVLVTSETPQFGHVAGYAGELAAILIHYGPRKGHSYFSDVNLFAMRAGKPALVADLRGGDRSDGGIHAVKIAGRRLVVEVYAPQAGGASARPRFVDTVRYRLASGVLVRDGKPERRKAYVDRDY